jgi:hypothetical protein
MVGELALQGRLQPTRLVSICNEPPFPVSCSPSFRDRSTSIQTSCSSDVTDGIAPPADSSMASYPIVSLTWRLSVDQQIRR